jgi:parvulin-like peptidyl-prolyl isomerase
VAQEAKNEKKAIARKRIEKARKSIQDGRPFEEVAREYSEDNAAAAGGDIGFIRKGYMPKEFDATAFTIEPGKLSEIVQTIHGYHILEVVEKQPEGVVPYEKVKDFVGKYLSNELAKKKRNELVQALKAKAKIEVLSN